MPRHDPPKRVSLKEAAAILAPLSPEGLPAPEAPRVPLPQAAARDVTGLRAPSLEAGDESALAPILSRWVMQRQDPKKRPDQTPEEFIASFVKFAATEGYPKSLPELKAAMEWIFDPNASIDAMPPQALLADLFLGFLPVVGELQAARDTYRDVEQDEVSGWTGLAAVGMLPMVPNLRSAVIAAKNAEKAARASGRVARVVRPIESAAKELLRAYDPQNVARAGQRIASNLTSLNQVPAIFASKFDVGNWMRGGVNLDLGGGGFDKGTARMAERGIENLVVDPHARDAAHMERQLARLAETGGADTATLSNVLNVIDNPDARRLTLQQARDMLKQDGELYVTVHEGTGSGVGIPTTKGWQENRKLADYVEEVAAVFGPENVSVRNGVIVARAPEAGRWASGTPALLTHTADSPALAQRVARAEIEALGPDPSKAAVSRVLRERGVPKVEAGRDPVNVPRAARPDVPARLDVAPEPTIARAPTPEEAFGVARRLEASEQHGARAYMESLRGESTYGLADDTIRQAQETFDKLNPEQMIALTLAGSAKRGWYNSAGRMLRNMFGDDTPRFVALLASLSPQTSVEANLENAFRVWGHWEELGRPSDPDVLRRIMAAELPSTPVRDRSRSGINKALKRARDEYGVDLDAISADMSLPQGWKVGEKEGTLTKAQAVAMFERLPEEVRKDLSVLEAWYPNTVRALGGSEDDVFEVVLSGSKVDSFMRNLLGDEWAATLDTHMARVEGISQERFSGGISPGTPSRADWAGDPGLGWGYLGSEARTAQVADMLTKMTGEVWTPAQVQESMWTTSKAINDWKDKANLPSFAAALQTLPARNLGEVVTFGEQLADDHIMSQIRRINDARVRGGRGALGLSGVEELSPPRMPSALGDPLAEVDFPHLEAAARTMDQYAEGQYLVPSLAAAYLARQQLGGRPAQPQQQEDPLSAASVYGALQNMGLFRR